MKNYRPTNLQELSRDLACLTPNSKIISGGTDLIIRLNQGLEPDALLYMGSVEGIADVYETDDEIYVGAGCTHTALEHNQLLQKQLGAICDAASDVGSPQIRNHGTIGGNIANASPAGDMLPVLFLLEPQVVIATIDGLREAPINEVVLGPAKTSLTHQEAIIGFKFKKRTDTMKSAFVKLGFRGKVTISRIGMAVEVKKEDNVVKDAKVIAGAISLTPKRVEEAEKAIINTSLGEEAIAKAGKAVSDLIMKITPEKFDRDYKVYSAKGVVEDVLLKLK